jgi:hypothetical protein
LEGPPRQPVVRLRVSLHDDVLLVPRAPDILAVSHDAFIFSYLFITEQNYQQVPSLPNCSSTNRLEPGRSL